MTNNDKKKSLGKGLNEIFGGDVKDLIKNISNEKTFNSVVEVDLDFLLPNPFQPRKNFDEFEIKELAISIKRNGLLNPIILKESDDKNKYFIVAGERRTRAFKYLELKKIKAIIIDIDNEEMQTLALIENLQRSNLNPIEIAKSLKNMIEFNNLSQEKLSKIIGKSRSYIANLLSLLKLDEIIISGVLEGKISYGHAKVLVTLDNSKALEIYEVIISKGLSVRKTENLVKAIKLDKQIKHVETKAKELIYAEKLINKKLKSDVKITKSEIRIKYKNKNELKRILERMEAIENN